MSRLLNSSIAEIQSDRFKTVELAVKKFEKTVILKGPHTIVGDRDQPLSVNVTGNPGMATAGMGDVLSGVIGALLSQDLPPYCAATVAAYWHGSAADACAESIGPIGYLASDVADMLPKARAKLTASCEARSRVRSLPLSCPF
jgi:NAD(P)H-hydrate epimerase